jgi:hypothetical protein
MAAKSFETFMRNYETNPRPIQLAALKRSSGLILVPAWTTGVGASSDLMENIGEILAAGM